ncbi:MAG: sigma-70 family RNA polymerase sigma factor [Planctomycetes bacterium]|nr:sigma-70 family RNA polymerase sigma factor [Planctomycetota bacterium]
MTDALPSVPSDVLLRHALWLRGLARQLVHDEPSAEDVVQDTWVAALEHPPAQPESARAWLARVARRFASRERRRLSARAEREEHVARPERLPSTSELVEKLALERAVVDAVLALPEPQREVVLLRYYEELPPREVAARLGLRIDVYWARLKRAHELLKQDLRARLELRPGVSERVDWRMALAPLAGLPPALTTTGGAAAAGTLVATGLMMSTKTIAALALVALGAAGAWWLSGGAGDGANDGSTSASPSLNLTKETDAKSDFLRAQEGAPKQETLRSATEAANQAPTNDSKANAVAAGTRVSGTLVDQQGRPVANAQVKLGARDRGSDLGVEGLVFVELEEAQRARGDLRETQSDTEGRFAFEGLDAGGTYQIDVAHELLLSPKHRCAVEAGKTTDVGTLSLRLGAAVRGKVVDHLAQPLASSWVRAEEQKPAQAGFTIIRSSFRGKRDLPVCDAEGRFRVGPLDPQLRYELLISAPGSPRVTVPLQDLIAGVVSELAPIAIDRGSVLGGRVLDANGKGVAKAEVSAHPGPQQLFDLRAAPIDLPVVTDAEGRFELRGLKPAKYSVNAEAEGGSARAEEIAHDALGVELQFRATNRVSGIVRDKSTGKPVADARVSIDFEARTLGASRLVDVSNGYQESVATDAEGRFTFADLAAGEQSFRVESAQHAPARCGPFEIPAGGRGDLVLELVPGVELLVEVLAAADQLPIADAEVELFLPAPKAEAPATEPGTRNISITRRIRATPGSAPLEDTIGGFGERKKVRTDAAGIARFGGLEARAYELVASHAEHAPAQQEIEVRAEGSNRARLALHRGGTLTGRALAFGGAPLLNREIVAEALDTRHKGTHRATSDAEGRFRFDHLAPGAYRARFARSSGEAFVAGDMAFAFASTEPETEKAPDGVEASIVEGQATDIELRQSPRASVLVRVLDEGRPIADARVELKKKTSGPEMPNFLAGSSGRPTDAEGHVLFEDLEPGDYKLSWGPANAPIRDEKQLELLAETKETLEVELPGGVVAGVVEDAASRRPVAGARVEIQRAGGSGPRRAAAVMITRSVNAGGGSNETMMLGGDSSVRTDAEGRFRFEHLPAGQYELVVQADGFGKHTSAPFALAAREKIEDRLESLSPGCSIEGAFTGLEQGGEGMVLVSATLLDEQGKPSGQPTRSPTPLGSRYTLADLKPGRYRVSARQLVINGGESREAETVEVEVRAGEKKTQDLRF